MSTHGILYMGKAWITKLRCTLGVFNLYGSSKAMTHSRTIDSLQALNCKVQCAHVGTYGYNLISVCNEKIPTHFHRISKF